MKFNIGLLVIVLLASATFVEAQNPPIPNLALWQSRMLSYGQQHCDWYETVGITDDQKLASTFYDQMFVFHKIADYVTANSLTPNATYWRACADEAESAYRDYYVIPNGGYIQGYWTFSAGLRKDWEIEADATSKSALVSLSEDGAFCNDTVPGAALDTANYAREMSYCMEAYLDAEAVGEAPRPRRAEYLAYLKDYIDQWFVSEDFVCGVAWQTCDPAAAHGKYYIQPFMVGLVMKALIHYDTAVGDAAIQPLVKIAADWLWTNAWDVEDESFWYHNWADTGGGAWTAPAEEVLPAPDLNLLIGPAFEWLHTQGEVDTYRDRADAIFSGGVTQAAVQYSKQFNQNFFWSFDYVKWRQDTGGGPTTPHLRASAITVSDTTAQFTYGLDLTTGNALDYSADCSMVIKTYPAGGAVDTLTTTEGLATRSSTKTGLTASTGYSVEQSCTGLTSDTNLYTFTTKAAPAGGNRTVPIQSGDPKVIASVARATVRYDDNAALSSPATVQNTSCANGCTINLTLAAGLWYYRWEWQTAADAVLATGAVQPLLVQ